MLELGGAPFCMRPGHPESRPRRGRSAAGGPFIFILSQPYPSAVFALLQGSQDWRGAFVAFARISSWFSACASDGD